MHLVSIVVHYPLVRRCVTWSVKAPTHRPHVQLPSPITLLPLVWHVRQKSCIEHNASTCCQLHSSVYVLRLREMQWAGGFSVKEAGLEVYARNSLYFRSKQNLTISAKNSCILNMQRGITKRTQIHSCWTHIITAGFMTVLQNNENKKWQNGVRRKPMRTQYSAPPTHRTDSLAHRQSENPMAQTSDRPPPQTSHVRSDQTTSKRLRKLPTQLNTPNRNVPALVRVSPNASDVQRLGRCVPALTDKNTEMCSEIRVLLLQALAPYWNNWKKTLALRENCYVRLVYAQR